jgi:PD-(D/E)XK nuclease superfamily
MNTNDTNNANAGNSQLIYGDLSYVITGILMSVHNEVGQYAKEKQYGDVVERIFKEKGLNFVRELKVGDSGNILDMVVDNKIALEFKAKRILTKEDYYQT